MRSFQNVIVFLFALVAGVFAAQEAESYDATVYLTSTVFRVNTVTMSGSPSSAVPLSSAVPFSSAVTISSAVTVSSAVPLSSAVLFSDAVANQTSTIRAPSATYVASTGSYGTNGTRIKPTGSATRPSTPEFTGAASSLNVNAFVVALAAGVGYLVL